MHIKTILLPVLLGLIGGTAMAQTAVFTGITLVGDDLGEFDFFGDHAAVAANDDWLMFSAPREDIDFDNDGLDAGQGDIDVGSVYIYKRTPGGPMFHQKLVGERNNVDPDSTGDRLGAGLVLSGDILFVGVANDNNFPGFIDPDPDPDQDFLFAGQVYVYNHDAGSDMWVQVQKLTSDEPNTFGSFGARTDSSHMELFSFGNGQDDPTIALIGEVENGTGLPPVLHVFKRKKNSTQWQRVQKVGAPSGVTLSIFANAIEGVGKFALVTERGIDPVLDPSAVHVYRINPQGIEEFGGTPLPIQTLLSPNGSDDVNVCGTFSFGLGMDAADDIVTIGSPCDNTAGQAAGAVFVYSVDNSGNNDPLSLVQMLTSPNATPFGFFASNFGNGKQPVTTDGNLIAVGTANFSGALPFQDDVHVYARDAGASTFSLADSVPSPAPGVPGFEGYGQSVTLLGGDQLTIAQMSDGLTGLATGQVFLFDIL